MPLGARRQLTKIRFRKRELSQLQEIWEHEVWDRGDNIDWAHMIRCWRWQHSLFWSPGIARLIMVFIQGIRDLLCSS